MKESEKKQLKNRKEKQHIHIHKTKQTPSRKKQKRKKEPKKKDPEVLQCPQCQHWFTSNGSDYKIHLSQCQIVRQSDVLQICQEGPHELKQKGLLFGNNTYSFTSDDNSRISLKNQKSKNPLLSDKSNLKSSCDATKPTLVTDVKGNFPIRDQDVSSYILYEHAWTLFENVVSLAHKSNDFIKVCHIPFPPGNKINASCLGDFFGLSNEATPHMKRLIIKKHLMRW